MRFRRKRRNRYTHKKAGGRARLVQTLTWGVFGIIFSALVCVFSFFSILVYDFFTQSRYFTASRIDVQGAQRLSRQQVLHHAGLGPGVNILSVSLPLVRSRLLTNPWIRTAEVSRDLPDGIDIRIEERIPVAILDLGQRFFVDTTGEIFKKWEQGDPDRLPVVTGLTFSHISVRGEPMSVPFASVMEFLRTGYKATGTLSAQAISTIHVDHDVGLTVFAFDPPVAIKMGYGHYPEKLERLQDVLYSLGDRQEGIKVLSIDLADPDRIVVRPVYERVYSGGNTRKEV